MEATTKDLRDTFEDAVRTYSEAWTAVEEAQNDLLIAREDLKTAIEECEAKGVTPEELDEMLDKHRLSYSDISNWE